MRYVVNTAFQQIRCSNPKSSLIVPHIPALSHRCWVDLIKPFACLTPDPLFRHGEPKPSSVGTGMPSPKNFSFVPEKNFQLTEKLQEQHEEFPYSPCTNSSIVYILLYMRCHPLCIYTYISIIITLFMNHLRASCRQEAVSLQTKQGKTLHFPKRGHSPTPVRPSTWKINMIYHCSTQSPEPIQNCQHRLIFHPIQDPVRKHTSHSLCTHL